MFFVYNPQVPQYTYDPEEIYQEYRRREYIATLQEQQRRAQFERELALEEERLRRGLALVAQQEAARRKLQASRRFAPRRPHQHVPGACVCGNDPDACIMPDSQEIFRRRLARQQEEEDRSRDFHREILTRIFGLPADDDALRTDDISKTESAAPEDHSPVPIATVSHIGCSFLSVSDSVLSDRSQWKQTSGKCSHYRRAKCTCCRQCTRQTNGKGSPCK
jgi:hypothetical protein